MPTKTVTDAPPQAPDATPNGKTKKVVAQSGGPATDAVDTKAAAAAEREAKAAERELAKAQKKAEREAARQAKAEERAAAKAERQANKPARDTRTRQVILEELKTAGYNGPVSFGKERLEAMLQEFKDTGTVVRVTKSGRTGGSDARTRGVILEELKAAGYTGPVSFGKDKLESMLTEFKETGAVAGKTSNQRTRQTILEELKAAGYTGAVSFGKDRLEEMLAEFKSTGAVVGKGKQQAGAAA